MKLISTPSKPIFAIFIALRKTISILLLFSLCCSLSGYEWMHLWRCAQARRQMQAFIHTMPLPQKVFDKEAAAKIIWEEENEFEYEGRMYDAVEKHWQNGKLYIRCLADDYETALQDQYLAGHNEDSNALPLSIVKLLSAEYLVVDQNTFSFFDDLKPIHHSRCCFVLTDTCLPVVVPPPNLV